MKTSKLSIGVCFLLSSATMLYSQVVPNDTVRNEKELEGVVIQGNVSRKTEAAILGEQKRAVIQKQAVGTEEISRKGISNVEAGLLKVTGITAVEGRGLFVRGLEERYNYLLINGLGSPSNNPFQKIIALKQFPTDVVGKLNIYKTFNANLYGDFAGATFDVETLTVDRPFTKVEFGVGVNTQTTFRNGFLMSEGAGGMRGYMGLNAEDRQLPSQIRDYRPSNYAFSGQEGISAFKDSWNVDEVKALPNTSIGFTTAQKFKAGENGNMNFMLSLNQSSDYQYREGWKNQYKNFGNEIVLNNLLRRKDFNYETESSALFGLGYKNNRSGTSLAFNAIYLQNSNNMIQDYLGYKNNNVQNIRFFRTNQQDISRFLDLQLLGSQDFGDRHTVRAGVSYVMNRYQQPDRKILEGSPEDFNGNMLPEDQLLISYGGNNIIRQYLDVSSKFYGSGFAEYSVGLGSKEDRRKYPVRVTLGYIGFADMRDNSYRFIFGKPSSGATGFFQINKNNPEATFQADLLNGMFNYTEESDAYLPFTNIYQFVNAGYGTVNYKPNESWDILLGGRFENDMSIIRYNRQGVPERSTIAKNNNYFLPSLSIKNALNSRNNIRFSFSKTITRPVLIETMPISYINPDNESIVGNPNIQNSENYNVDLKWELYPTNKEIFAVNLFGKRIDNAIERSFVTSGDANGVTVTFYNARRAILAGVELEAILGLNRISETLSNFYLGANATVMYSDVERSDEQLRLELPEGMTVDQLHKRGLQGASPYTINADLKYEVKNRNNLNRTLSLVYNVSGSKIFAVGSAGTDNYYERPFSALDIIYQEQFTKNWNLKLGVQNILNRRYQIQLGDENYVPVNINDNYQYTDYFRGITFNATVGYTF